MSKGFSLEYCWSFSSYFNPWINYGTVSVVHPKLTQTSSASRTIPFPFWLPPLPCASVPGPVLPDHFRRQFAGTVSIGAEVLHWLEHYSAWYRLHFSNMMLKLKVWVFENTKNTIRLHNPIYLSVSNAGNVGWREFRRRTIPSVVDSAGATEVASSDWRNTGARKLPLPANKPENCALWLDGITAGGFCVTFSA